MFVSNLCVMAKQAPFCLVYTVACESCALRIARLGLVQNAQGVWDIKRKCRDYSLKQAAIFAFHLKIS